MAKNRKDTKHTRHISRRIYFVRNEEKCKMHKIDWCEGGLQLSDIGTKNVSEPDLTPRLGVLDSKHAMCMDKNGKDTKHTRHIVSRIHFVRNGESVKCTKSISVKEVCSWKT